MALEGSLGGSRDMVVEAARRRETAVGRAWRQGRRGRAHRRPRIRVGDNEGQGWVAWHGGGSRQPPMVGAGARARTAEVLTTEVRGGGGGRGGAIRKTCVGWSHRSRFIGLLE